jgi:repressor of nif and glnA expression
VSARSPSKAVERSQALREEIRRVLIEHPPLSPPLTAKHVQPRLSRQVALRTVRWHLRALRTGGDALPPWQFIP